MKKIICCNRCKQDGSALEMEEILVPRYVPVFSKPIGMKSHLLCKKCYQILQNWLSGEPKQ